MIPLFSPIRQNEAFFSDFEREFSRILRAGDYILGSQVERFEKALAAELGFRQAVGCASGTEALVLALRALDLPSDAEIITPSFSFVASTSAIVWAGFRPRFADVALETACVTVESVAAQIGPRTKAVIAVDLYGRRAPIRELRRLCDERGLFLIEDGAQSIGVSNQGPHLFATSFYPTKNVGALGDAGAVLGDDTALLGRVCELSRHGSLVRDHYPRAGTTGRLDTIQAAALSLKLPHLREWSRARQRLAAQYRQRLAPLEEKGVRPLGVGEDDDHVWALWTMRVPPEKRTAIRNRLTECGVSTGVYYSRCIPEQPAFQSLEGEWTHAKRLAEEVLSLPLFPELLDSEIEQILSSFEKAVSAI